MTISEIPVVAQYAPVAHGDGGFIGIPITYWLIIGISMLASMAVSGMFRRRFSEYSRIPLPVTGAQVAELMLRQNGIADVKVLSVPGELSDHYDPSTRTVNLSESVYAANSVAAAAVAAHECGHAVQHRAAYPWLGLRSSLVPVQQLSSNLVGIVLMIGMVLVAISGTTLVLKIGIALFAVTTLFAFVTLPVEFDASRRALAWLDRSGIGAGMEHENARKALFWAAMTYVVGALSSLAMLLYYVSLLSGSRRD